MTGCVVCLQDEGWCEFCPTPPDFDHPFENDHAAPLRVISDRDPGDENDFNPQDPVAAQWVREVEREAQRRDAVITHRSYKATYRLGNTFRTSTMIGFDSFQDTAYLAIRNRREGEKLVGLTELT